MAQEFAREFLGLLIGEGRRRRIIDHLLYEERPRPIQQLLTAFAEAIPRNDQLSASFAERKVLYGHTASFKFTREYADGDEAYQFEYNPQNSLWILKDATSLLPQTEKEEIFITSITISVRYQHQYIFVTFLLDHTLAITMKRLLHLKKNRKEKYSKMDGEQYEGLSNFSNIS